MYIRMYVYIYFFFFQILSGRVYFQADSSSTGRNYLGREQSTCVDRRCKEQEGLGEVHHVAGRGSVRGKK